MKVLIHDDADKAADCVAGLIAARLARAPASVLGLATGGTMEAVYSRLIAAHRAGTVSFAQAHSFNLDEYVGLGIDPLAQKILVIKSTNHFYAAFQPIAAEILYCSAGRPYPNDPATNPYRLVRRDIWPRMADPFGESA